MNNVVILVVLMKRNKKVTVEPLFKNYKETIHFYSWIEDSEVVLVLERKNAGLKKLSSFV
jgi:hypothetical protein